eukprot:1310348-Rhodomonas_salina.1
MISVTQTPLASYSEHAMCDARKTDLTELAHAEEEARHTWAARPTGMMLQNDTQLHAPVAGGTVLEMTCPVESKSAAPCGVKSVTTGSTGTDLSVERVAFTTVTTGLTRSAPSVVSE